MFYVYFVEGYTHFTHFNVETNANLHFLRTSFFFKNRSLNRFYS